MYLDDKRRNIADIRIYNNGLVDPFDNVYNCVYSLVGIQAQYFNCARISIRNRVDYGITDFSFPEKSVIRFWGQRNTLHLFAAEDYNLITDLFVNENNWVKKYAQDLNLNCDRLLDEISLLLQEEKMLSAYEIKKHFEDREFIKLFDWSGAFILSSYNKILYSLVSEKNEKKYVKNDIPYSVPDINTLFERYYKYYGPASIDDFFHWTGLRRNGELSAKMDLFLKEKRYLIYKGRKLFFSDEQSDKINIDYPVVLGKFDPLLVAYKDKSWICDETKKKYIWKKAGQIDGVIISEAGVIATWKVRSDRLSKDVDIFNFDLSYIDKSKIETRICFLINEKKENVRFMYRSIDYGR